jgi:hypothetical protein
MKLILPKIIHVKWTPVKLNLTIPTLFLNYTRGYWRIINNQDKL